MAHCGDLSAYLAQLLSHLAAKMAHCGVLLVPCCHRTNKNGVPGCGDSHVDHIQFITGYRDNQFGHSPILMRYKERFSGKIIDYGRSPQMRKSEGFRQNASRAYLAQLLSHLQL